MPVLFYARYIPVVFGYFCPVNHQEKYETVVGLEVHAQLSTVSKLFCADPVLFGAAPNTQVSPISLAHPGTLPVMNEAVIEKAVKLGLALNCTIVAKNYFARKNYFYPDLPKGYQVSQHTAPICLGGYLAISTAAGKKNVQLNRIHMEEDAGKSLHDQDENNTCIDLNRAGTPLLEIVTEPDLHSADEAYSYLVALRKLLRWLDVCDGNMEEGSMRCDANISIRLKGVSTLGTRVEVKNLNSIRNVKKAIEIEVARLINIVESGQEIRQETRSFNADNNTTFSLRSKEDADDYRYFPEPDLPPFDISAETIQQIRSAMPMLPAELEAKYKTSFGLNDYDAAAICADRDDARLFEAIIRDTTHYKAVANWMTGPLRSFANEQNMELIAIPLPPVKMAELVNAVEDGLISLANAAHKILPELIADPAATVLSVAERLHLVQESGTSALETWIGETLASMPEKVQEYKSGKKNLLGLFAGDVKKRSKGKADMQQVMELLTKKLNNI
ncbi:MAG: gatB [Ferruginibacter sp.]|nr:gatB [Ferruginibacter sp.]